MERNGVINRLEEGLNLRYDRTKQVLHNSTPESAEYKTAEAEMDKIIKEMHTYHKTWCDYQAKTEELRVEAEHNQRMYELEKDKLEEHARVEQERNSANLEIEREKQKLTVKRVVFEIAKIVIPTAMSIGAYAVFQGNVLRFEETGRVSSTAGRELHLPKFFK